MNVENDVFGHLGNIYTGPGMLPFNTIIWIRSDGLGYRLPFYIISPWTRGGHVFTEHADHNSQIMFVGELHVTLLLELSNY
jgi:phospholipase C